MKIKHYHFVIFLVVVCVITSSRDLFSRELTEVDTESDKPVKQLELPRHLRGVGLKTVDVTSFPLEKIDVGMLVGGIPSTTSEQFVNAFRGNLRETTGRNSDSGKTKRFMEGKLEALTAGGFNHPGIGHEKRLGVAPGIQLHVYQGAYSNTFSPYESDHVNTARVLKGLDRFKQKGMDVIHLGFSGEYVSRESLLHTSIQSLTKERTVVVTGAGDEAEQVNDWFLDTVPAVYDETITVSALTREGTNPDTLRFSSVSNYGESVDVSAPGWNTVNEQISTKMAAAQVTGAVSLLKAAAKKRKEEVTTDQVREILTTTGNRPPAGTANWTGAPGEDLDPLMNVKRALDYLSLQGKQTFDQYTVLVVPGLGTNNWNRVGIPYMNENLETFRSMNLRARRLRINTEASVDTNAKYIRNQVLKEARNGRKVLFFAHSKGGTDTTAALSKYPELQKHVEGVVAIQPVYYGSPVADAVISNSVSETLTDFTFKHIFNGSKKAVSQLTHKQRKAFLQKHSYPADEIPTVVLRSTFDRTYPDSILWPNQKLIEKVTDKANDGMVTLADSTIPGAVETITVKNLDHFEPGVKNGSPYTPSYLSARTMLELLKHVQVDGE